MRRFRSLRNSPTASYPPAHLEILLSSAPSVIASAAFLPAVFAMVVCLALVKFWDGGSSLVVVVESPVAEAFASVSGSALVGALADLLIAGAAKSLVVVAFVACVRTACSALLDFSAGDSFFVAVYSLCV